MKLWLAPFRLLGEISRGETADNRLNGGWLVFPRLSIRWLVAAAAMAASATALHAALPTSPDVSGRTSLAGQLLIATAALRGPPFEHTVILVVQHGKDGALGIVINRPLEERSLVNLLEAFGGNAAASAATYASI